MCGQILFLNWCFSFPINYQKRKVVFRYSVGGICPSISPSAPYKETENKTKQKTFCLILRINLVVKECPDIQVLYLLNT